jgi:hypothetical protein
VAVPAARGLRRLRWWQWALIGVGVLVLVGVIVNAVNGRTAPDADRPGAGAQHATQQPAEDPVEMVDVPDLVGSAVAEAPAALEASGLTLSAGDAGDDWPPEPVGRQVRARPALHSHGIHRVLHRWMTTNV